MIFYYLSKCTFLLSFHFMFANLLIENLDAHDDHLSLDARIVDWYCYLVTKSCLTLLRPHGAYQASLSMGFPRQEYWSGLLFSSPGDLLNPRTELGSPALQVVSCIASRFFTNRATGEARLKMASRQLFLHLHVKLSIPLMPILPCQ